MDFKITQDNLQLRSCDRHLLAKGGNAHCTASIDVVDNNDLRYVAAYWERSKDGYDLKFVGGRPFDAVVGRGSFMALAKHGQQLLDEHFEKTREY